MILSASCCSCSGTVCHMFILMMILIVDIVDVVVVIPML